MSRLALVLAVVLGTTSGAAQALDEQNTTLSDISGQLVHGDMLCSDFEQEKHLQALARPLLSSGKLIFVAGQGVLWQVLTPYPARILVRSGELIQWDEDGNAHKSSAGKAPIFRALSSVFHAMFRGQFEVLHDTFDLSATQAEGTWRLTLIPKDEILATVIREVRAAGGRHVEEISILETRGDQTLIRLRNPRVDGCGLDDTEKTYFAR